MCTHLYAYITTKTDDFTIFIGIFCFRSWLNNSTVVKVRVWKEKRKYVYEFFLQYKKKQAFSFAPDCTENRSFKLLVYLYSFWECRKNIDRTLCLIPETSLNSRETDIHFAVRGRWNVKIRQFTAMTDEIKPNMLMNLMSKICRDVTDYE